ncbi:MAG: DegT/DnrJ/EryC1/StrS family aminotransferase [Lentisphaerae bacterium]|nr:DegT/DnrJ/EryC1/StrS family aminotransferase [Lentisphaerota bacterium]
MNPEHLVSSCRNSIVWPGEFPGAHWVDVQEEQAVLDVLRNGSLFRYYGIGAPAAVDRFEAAACAYYGAPYALAVNSGTGALLAAMSALGVGPGGEVIVPAFLWVATVGAVVQCNAIPVLCEVDDSLNMDPAALERAITARTRLIVPVHMAGAPCDMDGIMAVARRHGIPVLEDCAQCNGGEFHGRKVGTFGDLGIFSLQLNKNITCGEGGLIVTKDRRLFERAFSAHDMGLIRRDGRLAAPEPYALSWGAGRRMTELCGAVAAVQLTKLPAILDRMRGSKRRLKERLAGLPGVSFRRLPDPAGDTGPFLILMLPDEARARAAVERMQAGGLHSAIRLADYGMHIYSNITALVNRTPLSPAGNPWNLPGNTDRRLDYDRGACPRSDALFAHSVLLPIPSILTPELETAAAWLIRAAVAV